MDLRSSSTQKLTKKCKATDVLRDMFRSGRVTSISDPEEVYEMHEEFEKYSQERFPLFFKKRMQEFESKQFFPKSLSPPAFSLLKMSLTT